MMIDPHQLHQLSIPENKFIDGVKAYGVFDGHGINGHFVSQFIKNQLPSMLYGISLLFTLDYLFQYLSKLNGSTESEYIKDAIFKSYAMTNQDIWNAEFDTNLSGTIGLYI